MDISLFLIVIGIILALLVSGPIGIACIVVGLILLIWPQITTGR